jgi:heme-degrading monooxygenase HmoA
MAAIVITYDLPAADQMEEYVKWALDVTENVHLKLPGIQEVRAYRDPLRNTPQAMVIYEFDSLDSAIQYMRSDTYIQVSMEAVAKGCKNLTGRLLDASPVIREPARPTSR